MQCDIALVREILRAPLLDWRPTIAGEPERRALSLRRSHHVQLSFDAGLIDAQPSATDGLWRPNGLTPFGTKFLAVLEDEGLLRQVQQEIDFFGRDIRYNDLARIAGEYAEGQRAGGRPVN